MKHLNFVSVPVSDQERAKKFYVDKIGFELQFEGPHESGAKFIVLGIPGAQTSIVLVTWFETMPAGSLRGLVIETDKINDDLKRLKSNGVNAGEVEDLPWGSFVEFEDPDGNRLVLREKKNPEFI